MSIHRKRRRYRSRNAWSYQPRRSVPDRISEAGFATIWDRSVFDHVFDKMANASNPSQIMALYTGCPLSVGDYRDVAQACSLTI